MSTEIRKTNKYRGFSPLTREVREQDWSVHFTGRDYSKSLLRDNVSLYMLQNDKVRGFIDELTPMLVELVDDVKYIRDFTNICVPKDYKKIN